MQYFTGTNLRKPRNTENLRQDTPGGEGVPSREKQETGGNARKGEMCSRRKRALSEERALPGKLRELVGRLPRLLHQQIRRNDIPVHIRQLWSNRRRHVLVRAIRLLRDQMHRIVPRGSGVERQVIRADHTGNRRNRRPKRRRKGNGPQVFPLPVGLRAYTSAPHHLCPYRSQTKFLNPTSERRP